MGLSDNNLDIDIYKTGKGWKVVIQYWYYHRRINDEEEPKLSSGTTYTWYTECKELIEWFQKKTYQGLLFAAPGFM